MSKEQKQAKEPKKEPKRSDEAPKKSRIAANKEKKFLRARKEAMEIKHMKVPRGTARAKRRKQLQGV